MRQLSQRLRYWIGHKRVERELAEEIEFHRAMKQKELERSGMPSKEAGAASRRAMGNVTLAREDARAIWIWPWLEHLLQDVRYAGRVFANNRGFTLVAVLTLAIGIGANTAVFSVVNAVLVRPLPYEDPEELTVLWTNFGPDLPQNMISGPEFVEMREFSTLFEDIAVVVSPRINLTGPGEPEPVQVGLVSGSFFRVLGIDPAQGRLIEPADDVPGGFVVVISDGLWRRRFGGDPGVLGTTINLDNSPTPVVGILPAGFEIYFPDGIIPRDVDVWMPLTPAMQFALGSNSYAAMSRGFHLLSAIARMKKGVTLDQAQADMDAVAIQIQETSGEYDFEDWGITVDSLHGDLVETARPGLILLFVAVAFVLLIACVNVASLMLARAASREREIALRTALGAGRWRVLRQLLTESVTTALIGGLLGLFLAVGLVQVLSTLIPANLPRGDEIGVDIRVLFFVIGISVVTGVLFGLVPVFHTWKHNPAASLKDGVRGATRRRGARIHSLLVVVEVALAMVLLTGAGLMTRSFRELLATDPGYDPRNVLTFRLNLPEFKYSFVEQAAFYDRLIEQMVALPGVVSVAASSGLPLGGYSPSGTTWVNETTRFPDDAAFIEATHSFISPDYFPTLGIGLIDGRDFNRFDTSGSPAVAIVDEEFARRFWPDDDPIGKLVAIDPVDSDRQWSEVVGVVAHSRADDLATVGREHVYFPYDQVPLLAAFGAGMFVVLKTESDPSSFLAASRNEVRALDPDQPIDDVATMMARVDESLGPNRFSLFLLSGFAVVALILAIVGVYGVVSYSVTQRNHEIGIRMALGARPGDAGKLIGRQALSMVVFGVVLGMGGALLAGRWIRSLLYEVTPTDPTSLIAAAAVSLIVAAIATGIPVIRAIRIDPASALRQEN